MSKSDKEMEGCVLWTVALIVACIALVLEVFVGQWLFGVFGWHFGFWKMLGILVAVNFIFGGIKYRGSGKG